MQRLALLFIPFLIGCSAVRLDVRSTPSDARLEIDGVDQGGTPALIELARNQTYDLAISAPGYQTWRTAVHAVSNQTLHATLMPTPVSMAPAPPPLPPPPPPGSRATLTVFVEPAGVVTIDDVRRGTASKANPVEVVYRDNPTLANIVVDQPGFKRWTRSVSLEPGRDNRVFIQLEGMEPWYSYTTDAELLRQAVEQIVAATANLPTLRRTAKIAVLSIDHAEGSDRPLQALIDDALITTLTQAGFTPAERDDDLLVQLAHSGVGDSLPYRIITDNKGPDKPFVYNAEIATDQGEYVTHQQPSSTTQRVTSSVDCVRVETETIHQETIVTDVARRTRSLIGYVPTADQFLAYRVLEVGLSKTAVTEGETRNEPMLYRRAELRVHIRVIDAPSGRITWAGFLTGRLGDEIPARVSLDLANPPNGLYSAPLPDSGQNIWNPIGPVPAAPRAR